MARRRWIADRHDEAAQRAWLTGANAEHLVRVLRAQPGQQYEIATPNGVFLGTIFSIAPDAVEFTLGESLQTATAPETHLLLSIFKFDRFEWALGKAVELGVTSITPVISARTEKHLATAADKRLERWRRIAKEAAQQSRQSSPPFVANPQPLEVAAKQSSGSLILLDETEQTRSLWSALTPDAATTLAIGPEGGWTPAELSFFSKAKWTPTTLGTSILRAETAVIAALALVNQARLQP